METLIIIKTTKPGTSYYALIKVVLSRFSIPLIELPDTTKSIPVLTPPPKCASSTGGPDQPTAVWAQVRSASRGEDASRVTSSLRPPTQPARQAIGQNECQWEPTKKHGI